MPDLCLHNFLRGAIMDEHSDSDNIVFCIIYSICGKITRLMMYSRCLFVRIFLCKSKAVEDVMDLILLIVKVREPARLNQTPKKRTDSVGGEILILTKSGPYLMGCLQ